MHASRSSVKHPLHSPEHPGAVYFTRSRGMELLSTVPGPGHGKPGEKHRGTGSSSSNAGPRPGVRKGAVGCLGLFGLFWLCFGVLLFRGLPFRFLPLLAVHWFFALGTLTGRVDLEGVCCDFAPLPAVACSLLGLCCRVDWLFSAAAGRPCCRIDWLD